MAAIVLSTTSIEFALKSTNEQNTLVKPHPQLHPVTETNAPSSDLSLRILPYYVYANPRWSQLQKVPKFHLQVEKETMKELVAKYFS